MEEKIFDDARKNLLAAGFITLDLRVHPNAKRTACKEIMSDGSIKIDLAAPADDGKANAELLKFLADAFSVSRTSAEIISGDTNRRKIVRITLP